MFLDTFMILQLHPYKSPFLGGGGGGGGGGHLNEFTLVNGQSIFEMC